MINQRPQVKKIEVGGHASSDGDAAHNLVLSNERAAAVGSYLLTRGVPAAELAAKGYGVDRPIADNATEEGREKNRRVEFVILQEDVTKQEVQIDPKTGTEKVVHVAHETVGGGAR